MISFTVPGTPRPQGSTRSFKHSMTGAVITAHQGEETLKPWRSDVKVAAIGAWERSPTMRAVQLKLAFTFGFLRTFRRKNGQLKDWAMNEQHTKRPDLDKLQRAVLDALTGVVYLDDSQVVDVHATKRYGDAPGLDVEIREL